MKYYVDTCIWIDYWENRQDNLRPLGEFALKFFTNLEDEDIVYYSDLTLKELNNRYSDDVIAEVFKVVECELIHLETYKSQLHTATIIARTGLMHWTDALHATLAKEADALLITRDKQILNSGFARTFRPEELI